MVFGQGGSGGQEVSSRGAVAVVFGVVGRQAGETTRHGWGSRDSEGGSRRNQRSESPQTWLLPMTLSCRRRPRRVCVVCLAP